MRSKLQPPCIALEAAKPFERSMSQVQCLGERRAEKEYLPADVQVITPRASTDLKPIQIGVSADLAPLKGKVATNARPTHR